MRIRELHEIQIRSRAPCFAQLRIEDHNAPQPNQTQGSHRGYGSLCAGSRTQSADEQHADRGQADGRRDQTQSACPGFGGRGAERQRRLMDAEQPCADPENQLDGQQYLSGALQPLKMLMPRYERIYGVLLD